MATFRIRNGRVTAIVRRKGIPPQYQTFDSKGAAQRWARKIEARIELGDYRPAAVDAGMLVREAIDRYLQKGEEEKLRAGRRVYHLTALKRLRLEMIRREGFTRYALNTLPPAELIDWRDRMLVDLAPATVTKRLNDLSKLYRVARKEWQITGLLNPLDDVTRPGGGKPRERRLQPGEEERLLAAARQQTRLADLHGIIIVALETGMRRGEIMSFSRADVANRVVYLQQTKNGDRRAVPLSSRALQAIPARLSAPVFQGQPHSVTTAFREACRVAGITGLHFHDLRHEAISRFFERGFDIMEVAEIVGHKTLNQLRGYTHHRAERLAKKLG